MKDKQARFNNAKMQQQLNSIQKGSLADVVLRLANAESKINTLNSKITDLKSRVETLEGNEK